MRRIGLLMATADDREGQARVTALRQALQELGWTDGRNIQIEARFGGGDASRIRAHAAELVALAPDVLNWPRDARYPGAAAGDQFHSHRYGGGQ
jgi:putative ABC transport system substrate-binding protein